MNREQLDAFYRATTFLAYPPDGGEIALRIGRKHPELDPILEQMGAACWAFVTACNPRSKPLTAVENAARMEALHRSLTDAGYTIWPGLGVSDFTDWTPEESFLVFGMSGEQANRLSKQYDQNAYVYGDRGAIAELVWTDFGTCHVERPATRTRPNG